MEGLWVVVGAVTGVILGAVGTWLLLGRRLRVSEECHSQAVKELSEANQALNLAGQDRATAEARAERLPILDQEVATLRTELRERDTELTDLKKHIAAEESRMKERADQHESMVRELTSLREQFAVTFENLSNQTLDETRKKFFVEAENLLKTYRENASGDMTEKAKAIEELLRPVHEQLKCLDEVTQTIETKRTLAHGELKQSLESLGLQQTSLEKETTRLVKALQDPGTAGSWGEMVLERVLEMAGLEGKWSYDTQETSKTEDGHHRPDVVVTLPGSRAIVIDSKAPFRAYLDALATEDAASRGLLMTTHANKLLEHAKVLAKRDYARRDDALDFTVLFVPSEAGFRAAVEAKPSLIEDAMTLNVFLATPTTLLALLRAIAYGWRQEKLAQEAIKVQADGRKLYESFSTLIDHYVSLGRSLKSAADHFNKFGGSLEASFLPAARRFKDAGISTQKEVAEITPVEFVPRSLNRATSEVISLPGFEETQN